MSRVPRNSQIKARDIGSGPPVRISCKPRIFLNAPILAEKDFSENNILGKLFWRLNQSCLGGPRSLTDFDGPKMECIVKSMHLSKIIICMHACMKLDKDYSNPKDLRLETQATIIYSLANRHLHALCRSWLSMRLCLTRSANSIVGGQISEEASIASREYYDSSTSRDERKED